MAEEKEEITNPITKFPMETNSRGLVLRNLEDMFRFATAVQKSGLAPSSFRTPEQILIAVQMGAEIGLSPMRSLSSYCVVKGFPRLWGDTPLALVKQSGLLEYHKEFIEGEIGKNLSETPDDIRAICITKRKGDPEEKQTEFTVGDARLAGLWGKEGTWLSYPKRMLVYRARAFNLRDNFGDVLGGQTIAEEYQDMPPEQSYDPTTPKRSEREAKKVESKITDAPAQNISEILQKIVDAICKRVSEKYGLDLTEEKVKQIMFVWADLIVEFGDLLDEDGEPTELDNPLTWPVGFCQEYLDIIEDYLLPVPVEVEAVFKPQTLAESLPEGSPDTHQEENVNPDEGGKVEIPNEPENMWKCSACGGVFDKYKISGKGKTAKRQCPKCLVIDKVVANKP